MNCAETPEHRRTINSLSLLFRFLDNGGKQALLAGRHIGCLRTFGSLDDVKGHFLTFGQGLEAFLDDGRVVDKDVLAFGSLNEAVAFASLNHFTFPDGIFRTSSL